MPTPEIQNVKARKRTKDIFTPLSSRENYFGETLRELRKQKNLTQGEAANKLGVTQSQWSSYENGSTKLNVDAVIVIANKFEIDPIILFGMSLDKSRCSDPVLELTFQEYKELKDVIEGFRQNKVKDRVKARMQELGSYIGA